MEWSRFLDAFSSCFGVWEEIVSTRVPDKIELIDDIDGTTNQDRQSSDWMIKCIKQYFGTDIQVLSEEEENLQWQGTGFIIDPIDGSWNYLFGYPTYCRVVSYVEHGYCHFFSIFSEVDKKSICSNGELILCNGQALSFPSITSPIIAVMYNMHYSMGKKKALQKAFEQIMADGHNIRVSGSPGYDLYSLLLGSVGGVLNLSPNQFDASPILNCLSRSLLFEVQYLTLDPNTIGQFISRRNCSFRMRDFT